MRQDLADLYAVYQRGVLWLIRATGTEPFFEAIVRWLAKRLA